MSRTLLIGLAAAMMSGLWATDAVAQRDARAKARGEFGKGFFEPSYRPSRGRSIYYQPARTSTDSFRRFSYEPIGINPGDAVVVHGDDVKLMKGTNVVGTVPNGLNFKVTKIINGWLGAVVEVDGRKLTGWVWHKNVTHEESVAAESPEVVAHDTAAQAQTFRRFSYEPSQSSRSYRTYEGKKQPWQYPKTDPRRYRH